MPAKDLDKFHEHASRIIASRKFRDLLNELDTNPQAREEAKRDTRAFVKKRVPELPDEAEVEFGEGSFYLKCCCWGFCVTVSW